MASTKKRKAARHRYKEFLKLSDKVRDLPLSKVINQCKIEDLVFWVGIGGELPLFRADFNELKREALKKEDFRKGLRSSPWPFLKHIGWNLEGKPNRKMDPEKLKEIKRQAYLWKIDMNGYPLHPADINEIGLGLIIANPNNIKYVLSETLPSSNKTQQIETLIHQHHGKEFDFPKEIVEACILNEKCASFVIANHALKILDALEKNKELANKAPEELFDMLLDVTSTAKPIAANLKKWAHKISPYGVTVLPLPPAMIAQVAVRSKKLRETLQNTHGDPAKEILQKTDAYLKKIEEARQKLSDAIEEGLNHSKL